MKAKTILPIIVGGIFLLIALNQGFFEEKEAPKPKYLVATIPLTPYGKIRAEQLTTKEWSKAEKMPEEYVPPEQVARLNGRFVRIRIEQGAPITEESLWPTAVTSLMMAKLGSDPTMRGVPVKVDQVSGGGGFVKPGDSVDLMAVGNLPGELSAKRFLEAVIVLAVNKRDSVRPSGQQKQAKGRRPRSERLTHVVLLLSPAEAECVKAVESYKGIKIQLLLTGRNARSVQTAGATVFDALGITVRDEPAKESPPKRTVVKRPPSPPGDYHAVQIQRGQEEETVQFDGEKGSWARVRDSVKPAEARGPGRPVATPDDDEDEDDDEDGARLPPE